MNEGVDRAARLVVATMHWAVTALIAVTAMSSILGAVRFWSMGFNVIGYSISAGLVGLAAMLLSPPVFQRISVRAKTVAWALVPLSFSALIWTWGIVNNAYEQTPEGAQKARAKVAAAALEADRARQEAERQESADALKEALEFVANSQRKVKGCMRWDGQISALNQEVKQRLHNPRSFEHVRTEMKFVNDDPDGFPFVVMTYRAENGFGALRTARVSAFIRPDDCTVRAMKEGAGDNFGNE
jgi:hypothetical protein